MLISGAEMLSIARQEGFAVPAYNISDWAMMRMVAAACEKDNTPWMVAIHPTELAHIGIELLPSITALAQESSSPITIHLDHGGSYQQAVIAIQAGFNSVMIDKSMLPFDQNVMETCRVVELAHSVGVSVEAELGTIGVTDSVESARSSVHYTKPEDAVEFVGKTQVDSLAIAIGTCHGLYPEGMVPQLRLDLLEEIRRVVDVPLVLHGGSNNPDDEIREATRCGINKVNISSDIKAAYYLRMREVLRNTALREPNIIEPQVACALTETVHQKNQLFGAQGKGKLYPRSAKFVPALPTATEYAY